MPLRSDEWMLDAGLHDAPEANLKPRLLFQKNHSQILCIDRLKMASYHRILKVFGRSIEDKTLQCDWYAPFDSTLKAKLPFEAPVNLFSVIYTHGKFL